MNERAARLIDELALAPHPEGGFYREIFRSPHAVTDRRGKKRSALTVIYFLLPENDVSAWHVLASDETWHFAAGDPLEVAILRENGALDVAPLGGGGPLALVIDAGRPFAARVREGGAFGLVTCCVAPGFEFEDFVLLDPADLARANPEHAAAIASFRPPRPRRTG